jgi:hypothetical protein
MDLATGSAGVLGALSAVFDGPSPVLPYLEPQLYRGAEADNTEGGERHGKDPAIPAA